VVPTIGAFDAKTHRHAARFGKYRRQAIKSNGFYEGLVRRYPVWRNTYVRLAVAWFLNAVREGTMMGHIVEHVALELQELAGMLVGFGRTRETAPRSSRL